MRVNLLDKTENFLPFILDLARICHTYLLELEFFHHRFSLRVSCVAESILEAFCLSQRASQLHHNTKQSISSVLLLDRYSVDVDGPP